jgi:demethylmenaquinone methyltransferase/2-methoxy-6-polyprenyl-1,4-benzoquinol methylase
MAFALRREGGAQITGADFSHAMLKLATAKSDPGHRIDWIEADALRLPFPDQSFDLVTSAFGFRNLADYDAGLREMFRVLKPGGECGILEFGEPGGILGKIYRVYFKAVLPRIGNLISGNPGAYSYLPASVERFPTPAEMLAMMKAAGFRDAARTPYTMGVAGLFRGRR